MGEADQKEKQLKDLSLSQLKAAIQAAQQEFIEERLVGLIDGVVKERLADYHAFCVARGLFRDPDAAAEADPTPARILTLDTLQ